MLVVFFDIGDTLASPIFSDDNRLKAFNVFPEAISSLEAVKLAGFEMGIISNAGDEIPESVNQALRECQLFDYFNPNYIVYIKKDSSVAFVEAAEAAGVKVEQSVFVGENSKERAFALEAGFRGVVPHPSLVRAVLDGNSLTYLRITLRSEDVGRLFQTIKSSSWVPLKISGGEAKIVYAITTPQAYDILRDQNFEVEVVGGPNTPSTSDLFLVRDDRSMTSEFDGVAKDFTSSFLADLGEADLIVDQSEEGVYLAIPWDRSIEDIHFPDSHHGHNEKLVADFSLFNIIDKRRADLKKNESLLIGLTSLLSDESFGLDDRAKVELQELGADKLRGYHQPYASLAPINGTYHLVSRHIRHADNRLVVDTLREDLKRIGGTDILVTTHRFQHEDLFLYNVVADYPGTEPDSLVLVTAHLDSTAGPKSPTYDPAADPAPGADDDASGVAAVLAIAETLRVLIRGGKKPKKTIRFVLFNAEEHGLIGSKAYARSQAAIPAQIAAVFQMDMIGYRGNQPATSSRFEVHAGFAPSKSVEDESLRLAAILDKVYKTVSPNLTASQIYPDYVSGNGTDPASGRSDHAPFQERGYAALVVSEDFFAGPKSDSPAAQPNPNYHMPADRQIDYEYAADIARVIAAAALIIAND